MTLVMFSVLIPAAVRAGELKVGEIRIHTEDIFTDQEIEQASTPIRWLRRGMNGLHFNTRHWVIRQELLFSEGEAFDAARLAETERNLRGMGFLNEIRVTAVDTTADGHVNILVDAHETWSLNTAVTYSRASGGDQRWGLLLSDRNVLGYGFTLGAGLGSDEISSYSRVWYDKRRALGTSWHVNAHVDKPADGHRYGVRISRPFYAQDDRWGLTFLSWDYLENDRYYLSNASPLGLDPAREASLYAELPRRETGFEGGFRVRLGSDPDGGDGEVGVCLEGPRLWRLGAGLRVEEIEHRVGDQQYWVSSDGYGRDLTTLLNEGEPLVRSEGTRSFAYLHLETLGRRWTKARYVRNYGPVEDLPLAWHLDLKLGPSGEMVGTNVGTDAGLPGESWRAEAAALRFFPLGPGLLRVQGVGYAQVGSSAHETSRYEMLLVWTAAHGPDTKPWLTRVHLEYGQGDRLAAHEVFVLGLDRGIRTLEFDGMAGDRLARWNIEQGKVMPWTPLGLLKSGAAVFYSGGSAWWNDEDRDLGDARHELGIGLRFGPTRSSRAQITRIDLTWNAGDFGSGPALTTTTRGTF